MSSRAIWHGMWTEVAREESMMKRILVAVDGSSTSVELVEAAVDIARSARGHRRLGREAKICLLQAITATSELPPSGLFLAPVASSASDTVARVRGFLADLERQIPEEHRDGLLVEVGSPSDVICRTARAYEADLVVIGAHRYGKLARVLGTNAAKVVNGIDRPVLVVRPVPGVTEATETPGEDGEDALRPDTAAVNGADLARA